MLKLLVVSGLLFFCETSFSEVTFEPSTPPERLTDLNYGRLYKASMEGDKIKFSLDPSAVESFKQEVSSGRTRYYHTASLENGNLQHEELISSSDPKNKQSVVRLSGTTYKSDGRIRRGSYSAIHQSIERGLLHSETKCVSIDYNPDLPSIVRNSRFEYCYTATPQGCVNFLSKINEVDESESMGKDIEACKRVIDLVSGSLNHLEPKQELLDGVYAINSASISKSSMIQFRLGKSAGKTLLSRIGALQDARHTCSQLISLWRKSGQIKDAYSKGDGFQKVKATK